MCVDETDEHLVKVHLRGLAKGKVNVHGIRPDAYAVGPYFGHDVDGSDKKVIHRPAHGRHPQVPCRMGLDPQTQAHRMRDVPADARSRTGISVAISRY